MSKLPDYIGPAALGLKMGVVVPGADLNSMIISALQQAARDELLNDNDVICVTESVVARAQNNFVSVEQVAEEVRLKLSLAKNGKVGVVFPITSRNRFSLILESIARAVPQGEVIVQMSFPNDEMGNRIISAETVERLNLSKGYIHLDDLKNEDFRHPITRIDYLALYTRIIEEQGARATIIFSNDPTQISQFAPDGIIAADIHTREATRKKISGFNNNVITLQDLCREGESWCEWGLLGSNLSASKKLKLAPREAFLFVQELQKAIYVGTGRKVEVLVYGDGAYKDPSTGIYELADPTPVFGATKGIRDRYRRGVKYKYLVDLCCAEGKNVAEIETYLATQTKQLFAQDHISTEGTTPRRIEDIIASLADLVSGSADAGTPVVIVKNILC